MATQIDKLTINFNARPTFRQGDETIDLQAKKDTLEVIGKDGQKKTIEGFKSDNGTFFRLKEKNGQFQVLAYGTPEQLAKSNLKVRNGDLTKARFGDHRFDQISPFKAQAFEIKGSDLRQADEFARNFHLTRRPGAGDDKQVSDKGRGEKSDALSKDQHALNQEAIARDKEENDQLHAQYMAAGGDKPVNMKALFEAASAKKAAAAPPERREAIDGPQPGEEQQQDAPGQEPAAAQKAKALRPGPGQSNAENLANQAGPVKQGIDLAAVLKRSPENSARVESAQANIKNIKTLIRDAEARIQLFNKKISSESNTKRKEMWESELKKTEAQRFSLESKQADIEKEILEIENKEIDEYLKQSQLEVEYILSKSRGN